MSTLLGGVEKHVTAEQVDAFIIFRAVFRQQIHIYFVARGLKATSSLNSTAMSDQHEMMNEVEGAWPSGEPWLHSSTGGQAEGAGRVSGSCYLKSS